MFYVELNENLNDFALLIGEKSEILQSFYNKCLFLVKTNKG